MRALRPLLRLAVSIVSVGTTIGCASTAGIARPAPFPNAPAAEPRPAPLGLAWRPAPLDLIRTALDLRGLPYRLGGESPREGFDCSGFVRYVFNQYHLELPRTVSEQFGAGAKVSPADVREG